MINNLRWGILGLGKIAHHFVNDLVLLGDHTLQAVASRNLTKAEAFQSQHSAFEAHGSYKELLSNPNVDIIYIATPHHAHKEWSIKAMEAGKHVLCEKPAGVNTSELSEMIRSSKDNNVFFMEALWSRFNPTIKKVLELCNQNTIGIINYINADFAFFCNHSDDSRLFNPNLAGGATLDIGIYPLFLSYLILGMPTNLTASSIAHSTGVDLQTSVILEYPSGFSNLYFCLNSTSDMVAKIHGTEGRIEIHGRWHESDGYTIIKGESTESFQLPPLGKGYTHEIIECKSCIDRALTESPSWSHSNSLDLIELCDSVRQQIGLKYPFE